MFYFSIKFLQINNDPLLIYEQYVILIFFLVIGFTLSCIMVILPYFLTGRSYKDTEKVSEYECGFEPFDSATRQPFTIHFYIVGILFLIFDVEIALIFPWSAILYAVTWYGFWIMMFFIFILTLGFIYEWKLGAISWKTL